MSSSPMNAADAANQMATAPGRNVSAAASSTASTIQCHHSRCVKEVAHDCGTRGGGADGARRTRRQAARLTLHGVLGELGDAAQRA